MRPGQNVRLKQVNVCSYPGNSRLGPFPYTVPTGPLLHGISRAKVVGHAVTNSTAIAVPISCAICGRILLW